MKIDFISTIFVIASTKCLTRSAELLDVSSSTVYKRLKKVEDYYQVKIFEKVAGQLELTDKGADLIKEIQKIDSINNQVLSKISKTNNKIHIAVNQGLAARLVREIISDYLKENKELSIEVSTITNVKSVEDFNGDFAITTTYLNSDKFNFIVFDEFVCYFVASLDYIAEFGEPKTIKGLEEHNVIVTPLETVDGDCFYCKSLDNKVCHFKLNSKIFADSKIVSNEFVKAGNGVGLIPERTIASGAFKNIKVLFDGNITSKSFVQVAINKNKKLEKHVEDFMECLIEKFNAEYI
ncbi:LysR family transcriptional regulator [Shewanella chilikensis]|uniref:LysR family transcriptional regulator n=1 Tax=Shewanella chilikensis TaxID=558541 RepID=UPI0030043C96